MVTTQIQTLKTSPLTPEKKQLYDEAGLTEFFELCLAYEKEPTTANLKKIDKYDLAQVREGLRKLPITGVLDEQHRHCSN